MAVGSILKRENCSPRVAYGLTGFKRCRFFCFLQIFIIINAKVSMGDRPNTGLQMVGCVRDSELSVASPVPTAAVASN